MSGRQQATHLQASIAPPTSAASAMRPHRVQDSLPLLLPYVFGATVGGAALAIGTVHALTLCVMSALVTAVSAAAWLWGGPMRARSMVTLAVATGLGLTIYTLAQCVPMPARWLVALTSTNADTWARALSPLKQAGPASVTISLDPGATRLEVLKGATYLAAFLGALQIARTPRGSAILRGGMVITAVILAVAALLHPAFGMHRVFGLYEPGPGVSERHVAPLLNANHLAAYLNVGLCIALATTLVSEHRKARVVCAATVVFLAGTQVWIASRGGIVCMVFGAVLTSWLSRELRRTNRPSPKLLSSIVYSACAIGGMALMALTSSENVGDELMERNLAKLRLFVVAMKMAVQHPLFGVGRGAFASTFPAYRDGSIPAQFITYSHPENIIAQWATEWGIPVAVLGLTSLAIALRPRSAIARSTAGVGAWAALCAVALQNLGDFSTEVPGVMLGVATCAAIVLSGTAGRPQRRLLRWPYRPRAVALLMVAFVGSGLALAAPTVGHQLLDDQRALYRAAIEHPIAVDDLMERADAAMLRHPAEPYIPFVVALRLAQNRDRRSILWVGASLERALVYGPAHLILARMIGAMSPSQARLEYRTAVEQAPELTEVVAREGAGWVHTYDDALELLGDAPAERYWGLVVAQLSARLPATVLRLDARLSGEFPSDKGLILRRAEAAVLDVEDDEPWCREALVACLDAADVASASAIRAAPEDCEPYVLRARAQIARGNRVAAFAELRDAAWDVKDRAACMIRAVDLAAATSDEAEETAALERLEAAGCADDTECFSTFSWAAERELRMGRPARALAMYKKAYEHAPQNPELLLAMARLTSKLELHAESARYFEVLAHLQPENQTWRANAASEHDAAIQNAFVP